MFKIFKFPEGYKIARVSLIEKLNPFFMPKEFVKNKNHLYEKEIVFKDLINAKKYIEIKNIEKNCKRQTYHDLLGESYYLNAAQIQFEEIVRHFDLDICSYKWADLWSGKLHWAIMLSRLLNQRVLAVDRDMSSYGDPLNIYLENVGFKVMNTDIDSLPPDITAAFLRSSIGAASIDRIASLNPNLELFIVIPEGIGCNEFSSFKTEEQVLRKYFNEVEKVILSSDLCIKGSHSNIIAFGREFPVIMCKGRKES